MTASIPTPKSWTSTFWIIVVAGSVITALSLGARSTFGVYLDPITETLGITRAQFSLAIAIQNIVWGLSQPFAGAAADKFGTAKVLAIGSAGYAAALLMMANANSAGALYLSAGLLVGVATGAASFSVVLSAVGRMVPPERSSMALGIVTAMGSVGQFFLVPLARDLIDSQGWRTTLSLLAAMILIVIAFTPFLRGTSITQQQQHSTHDPESEPVAIKSLRSELAKAASSRNYLLLNAGFFVCGFHVTFIGTHLISYSEGRGVGGSEAARALALIGLFNIIGSLTAGKLGTNYSKTKLLAGIYFLRVVAITAFVLVPISGATVVIFGAAIGTLWLSTVPLTGGIVNQQFGPTHAGTLFGIVFLSHQVGAFIGAYLGGLLADRFDSYVPVWWVAVGLGLFATMVHLVLDDGPIPDPPPTETRTPIVPTAAASVLLIAGGVMAVHNAAQSDSAAGDVASRICILHSS